MVMSGFSGNTSWLGLIENGLWHVGNLIDVFLNSFRNNVYRCYLLEHALIQNGPLTKKWFVLMVFVFSGLVLKLQV